MVSRAALLCLVITTAACQCRKSEPLAFQPPSDSLLLPIADRPWAEGAPDEGWCGEASIQMVALHFGAWVPQPLINSLGRSAHVDLWEEDIPTALDKLELSFERAQVSSRDEFVTWIIAHLRRGHPVIVGAKLLPGDHPEWDVDHLMPIVGFSPRGLVFNTNMDPGQEEIPWAALGGREGISFVSPTGKFYGFAVTGFRDGGPRVSLRVLEESPPSLKFAVLVGALDAGAWALQRDDLDGGVSTSPMTGEADLLVTISAGTAARFSAVPPGR